MPPRSPQFEHRESNEPQGELRDRLTHLLIGKTKERPELPVVEQLEVMGEFWKAVGIGEPPYLSEATQRHITETLAGRPECAVIPVPIEPAPFAARKRIAEGVCSAFFPRKSLEDVIECGEFYSQTAYDGKNPDAPLKRTPFHRLVLGYRIPRGRGTTIVDRPAYLDYLKDQRLVLGADNRLWTFPVVNTRHSKDFGFSYLHETIKRTTPLVTPELALTMHLLQRVSHRRANDRIMTRLTSEGIYARAHNGNLHHSVQRVSAVQRLDNGIVRMEFLSPDHGVSTNYCWIDDAVDGLRLQE